MRRLLAAALAAALGAAAPASAALLPNGDFSDGLNGWAIADGPNGRSATQTTVSFPVLIGQASSAARFQVGERSDQGNVIPRGVFLSRSFTSGATGLFDFSVDVAANRGNSTFNADAGTFRLLVDGVLLDELQLGALDPNQVKRGALSGATGLTAGTTVSVELFIGRVYTATAGAQGTPYQYVDNFATTAPAYVPPQDVPLPGSAPLLLAGLIGIAALRRRAG